MKFFQLIGTQRSGSNLFRLMLNEFDDVFAPHPPHLLKTFYSITSNYNNLEKDKNLKRLVRESQTPGGLNEQAVKDLRKAGFYKLLEKTSNRIIKRLNKSQSN